MIFQGHIAPEDGQLAGYADLIQRYQLSVPLPDTLAMISTQKKRYTSGIWKIFPSSYAPGEKEYDQLVFALKYEGIDLHIIKALLRKLSPESLVSWISEEPGGKYRRRIWFLYEWLTDEKLPLEDLRQGNFIELINTDLQYGASPVNSRRHRIRNNLPGVREFCPLIRKTPMLEDFMAQDLSQSLDNDLRNLPADIIHRAASFILLKDSKASYFIEGEKPPQTRAQRWAKAIGLAGGQNLSAEALIDLQKIVIESSRFVNMGWRLEGGFIGSHDRETGYPIPEHISARAEDIPSLIAGLISMQKKLIQADYDPVLAAASIAFGFVFIHPFADGNGRIHRYLIHHILAEMKFAPKGLIFPVSSAILEKIREYKSVLEHHSIARQELIRWKATDKNNVEVLNDTADLYRYFDATAQAEFLYSCVMLTVREIIPQELQYLSHFDSFKSFLENHFEMPDSMIDLMVRFLTQNQGKFSARAKDKEFSKLIPEEIDLIERKYAEIFLINNQHHTLTDQSPDLYP